MISVGQQYELQKCKHSWNNGRTVTITEVRPEDDTYTARCQDNKLFIVGKKNLKAI